MNIDKTEMVWVGKQREELHVRLERKYIIQVKNCVYWGGRIRRKGREDVEVRRRLQAGANTWTNMEDIMMDREISRN